MGYAMELDGIYIENGTEKKFRRRRRRDLRDENLGRTGSEADIFNSFYGRRVLSPHNSYLCKSGVHSPQSHETQKNRIETMSAP